jgi:hypothetical protein
VSWEKMRAVFGEPLVGKLAKYDPSAEKHVYPRYARVDDIRKMLEVEEMPADVLYGVVLDWCAKATDVREAAVAAREALAAAAAAAAEAEAAEE